ncbi:MAG: hypothetical protein OXN25_23965 [Candidatus Poribacteria bacterium]|nr:hypothetical protein [Candidatus Poribacteria bacterium]
MQTYPLSQLTEDALNALVTLHEEESNLETWEERQATLTSEEQMLLDSFKATLYRRNLVPMNEATLWSRAIYPLLRLAEQGRIQAWAGVPLKATYPKFELEGEADGALAPSIGGKIRTPYLIVHEAKRGLTAVDPQYQLYGEMLAAAWLNYKNTTALEQEIFGCYTVVDNWTFVRGVVGDIESEKPTLNIEFGPVYNGVLEAKRIVQILKSIVAQHIDIGT